MQLSRNGSVNFRIIVYNMRYMRKNSQRYKKGSSVTCQNVDFSLPGSGVPHFSGATIRRLYFNI